MIWSTPKVYAVKHKNMDIRMASRSGGIFTALSDEILRRKGAIYGCILTEDFAAIHSRATNEEIRNKMRGSKYIQSKMGDNFKQIKIDLENDMWVLFSGTSCQVAGLRNFLGCEYDKLLCVDIVCHGVPSPLIWKEYIAWQEKRNKGKIIWVDFRNKKDFGWVEHIETLTLDNNKVINSKIYTKLFYGHDTLRPSCYECPYKNIMHPGDITIGDYWGIEKVCPKFVDNHGVSLVLINNAKGEKIFKEIKNMINFEKTKLEDCLQPPLIAPYEMPDERAKFWENFQKHGFEFIVKIYGTEKDDKFKILSILLFVKRVFNKLKVVK